MAQCFERKWFDESGIAEMSWVISLEHHNAIRCIRRDKKLHKCDILADVECSNNMVGMPNT